MHIRAFIIIRSDEFNVQYGAVQQVIIFVRVDSGAPDR